MVLARSALRRSLWFGGFHPERIPLPEKLYEALTNLALVVKPRFRSGTLTGPKPMLKPLSRYPFDTHPNPTNRPVPRCVFCYLHQLEFLFLMTEPAFETREISGCAACCLLSPFVLCGHANPPKSHVNRCRGTTKRYFSITGQKVTQVPRKTFCSAHVFAVS